jgi:hypothetical protein
MSCKISRLVYTSRDVVDPTFRGLRNTGFALNLSEFFRGKLFLQMFTSEPEINEMTDFMGIMPSEKVIGRGIEAYSIVHEP